MKSTKNIKKNEIYKNDTYIVSFFTYEGNLTVYAN